MDRNKIRNGVLCLTTALLGVGCIYASAHLGTERPESKSLMDAYRWGPDHPTWILIWLFFFVGVFCGALSSVAVLLLDLCGVSGFILLALIDMIWCHSSHNLFPFELVEDALLGLVVSAGAILARWLTALARYARTASGRRPIQ